MAVQAFGIRMLAEQAVQPSPSLAASIVGERAATRSAASGWESDQENDSNGQECYSLPPPTHRCSASWLLCAVISTLTTYHKSMVNFFLIDCWWAFTGCVSLTGIP